MNRPTVLHAVAGLAALIAVSPLAYLVVRTAGADLNQVRRELRRPACSVLAGTTVEQR